MKNIISILRQQLLRAGRAIHRRSPEFSDKQFFNDICPVCGHCTDLVMDGVLWPELVLQWELNASWANYIDQREGLRCKNCRSNLRSRQLAHCIVTEINKHLGTTAKTLSELCKEEKMNSIQVAEINAAGDLHPILKTLHGLHYSEFGSTKPDIRSEDLLNLSYSDESFDLVITSDVLEHVPDIEQALDQIRRILKPNGLHIFSVPVIWYKPHTRIRAVVQNGNIKHLLPPSHHGTAHNGKDDFLVFYEFGTDFVDLCKRRGFTLFLTKDSRNPSLVTFISWRES